MTERYELDMYARGLSDRTIVDRMTTLRRVADGRDPGGLTIVDLSRYLANPDFSQATRCTYWSELNAFYRFAVKDGALDHNPMPDRPRQPRTTPRPLHPGHLDALLASGCRSKTRAMILCAAYAGLRVHEIAKLRGEDIDLVADTLTVRGKGGRLDVLPLHPVIAELAERQPRNGYWFPRVYPGKGIAENEPMKPRSVTDVISRAMRRAGVPGTAHQLRHMFATELVNHDVDLRTVQELMRHESLQTTQRYTAITDDRRRAAITRLPAPQTT